MTLTFVYKSLKVMSTIASHLPLNISETVRLGSKNHQQKSMDYHNNGHMNYDVV